MALFANGARFFRFRVPFRACSLLNEVGDPPFFYISDIINSSTLSGESLRKKSMFENFRANVLKKLTSSRTYVIADRTTSYSRDLANSGAQVGFTHERTTNSFLSKELYHIFLSRRCNVRNFIFRFRICHMPFYVHYQVSKHFIRPATWH